MRAIGGNQSLLQSFSNTTPVWAERSPMQLLRINELWRPVNAKPDPFAGPQGHSAVAEIQLVTPQRESRFRKDAFYGFCFCLKKNRIKS